MPTYVNDNGTWREVNESLNVNDNGTNREIDEAYVNDNGTWRLVYESEKPMILSSTFKIGGQKYGNNGSTGTDNVGFAGYGAGDLFILNAGLVPGTMFGRFSTDFRLLNLPGIATGSGGNGTNWQEIQTTNFTTGGSNSSYANTVIGITPSQLFYTINSSSYPNYYRAQPDAANSANDPFTGQPPTGGSFGTASATYNTASTANGTTNTQGASHTLKQIFTPGQSGREDYNRFYAVVDASVNSSVFPGEALTLTTQDYTVGTTLIPGQTFTMRFNLTESTISLPAQGRSSSPLAKAIRTTSQIRRDNGDLVLNIYNRLFGQGFSGIYFSLNPTIEIYDRVNLPFKSSSGGVEYRRVMSLMWQYQDVPISTGNPRTNSQIWFAVEGHGLPTNAWRRMEINGVSLDASLFSKSEVAANGSITPAYTLWMYVYPNEPVSAFGTVGSTINVNIYK
jgi:hypothetical protein